MSELKVGDKVICTIAYNSDLNLGWTYRISEIEGDYVYIDRHFKYSKNRFTLLSDCIKGELIKRGLVQDAIQRGHIKIFDYLAVIADDFIKEGKCNLAYNYDLIEEILQLKNNNMSNDLKITKERVLETIKKYPVSKDILEELFPEVKMTYKIGMRFREFKYRKREAKYDVILAQVRYNMINFISLDSGNRVFHDEVEVKNANAITQEELDRLTRRARPTHEFELIT